MHEINGKECICETLRLIYDDIYPMPESPEKKRITEHLVDAMLMAKKMTERLTYYYLTYQDQTGSRGVNRKRILGQVARMKMRKARRQK